MSDEHPVDEPGTAAPAWAAVPTMPWTRVAPDIRTGTAAQAPARPGPAGPEAGAPDDAGRPTPRKGGAGPTPPERYGPPAARPGLYGAAPPAGPGRHGYDTPPPSTEWYGAPPAIPAERYGAAPARTPGEYGAAPRRPSGEYGTPPRPSGEYGTPPRTPERHGQPPATPRTQGRYDATPPRPPGQYGAAPRSVPAAPYGEPAGTTYRSGGPAPAPPERYGPPARPEYGPPARPEYGAPDRDGYGAEPYPTEPYAAPARERYGPAPGEGYGAPREEYGAPREEHGAPREEHGVPPRGEYGAPPRAAQDSVPPRDGYDRPAPGARAPDSGGYGSLLAASGFGAESPPIADDPPPADTGRAEPAGPRSWFGTPPSGDTGSPVPGDGAPAGSGDRAPSGPADAGTPAPDRRVLAAPAGTAPVSAAPVSAAPVSAAPVSAAPVSAAPASPATVGRAPTGAEPVSAAPDGTAPVSAAPASAPPAGGWPGAATPAGPARPAPWAAPAVPVGAARPADPRPAAPGNPAVAAAPDPEQVLASFRWRFDPDTLREVVDDAEAERLREVREQLTAKIAEAVAHPVRARLLSLRAVVSRILGDLDAALADGTLAVAHAEATGELRRVAITQARLAHVQQWRGAFEEADRLFALANSPELPDRLRATLHQHAGKCAYDQGRYIEACNHLETALDLRRHEDPELIASTELALDALFRRVAERGWGPYPRQREEILGVHRPPEAELDERSRLWGFADGSGTFVIRPAFADVQPFREGVAWVRRPDSPAWLLLDVAGAVVIPAAAGYLGVGSFSDGLAWVSRDGSAGWFAIDRSNAVVNGAGFDDVRPFRRGVAAVCRAGRWGAVDVAGRFVVPPQYDGFATALHDGRYVDGFSDDGLAVVSLQGRLGVVDRTGRLLVPPAHPAIVIHPVAFLYCTPGQRWGALDRRGRPLVDPVFASRADVTDELDRLLVDTRPVL